MDVGPGPKAGELQEQLRTFLQEEVLPAEELHVEQVAVLVRPRVDTGDLGASRASRVVERVLSIPDIPDDRHEPTDPQEGAEAPRPGRSRMHSLDARPQGGGAR
ncbi:MAG: hypothetical protein ACYCXA_08280 [Actinomycetes bacterium]